VSLYTSRHFAGRERADALALIRDWPFATLITTTASEPHITHLPLLLENDAEGKVLTGHMACANPHWQAFTSGHTTAIFHGPHAYITPNWYVNPANEVPTWNYATVHVHGQPALIDEAEAKLAVVDRTSAVFEPTANPWRRRVEGVRLATLLDNIVAFTLPLTRVEAKFKMNQNKTAADRAQVAAQLDAAGHPDLAAMARWMREHEPKNEPAA
jgi:transcriptional regulator